MACSRVEAFGFCASQPRNVLSSVRSIALNPLACFMANRCSLKRSSTRCRALASAAQCVVMSLF
jgi:hypothetical protein